MVTQQPQERNFHIFYQLFSSEDLRARYNLTRPEDYRYLFGGKCVSVSGIDDAHNFMDVLNCFESLDFSSVEKDTVFSLLVAILKLGNLQFYDEDPSAMHPHSKVRCRKSAFMARSRIWRCWRRFRSCWACRRLLWKKQFALAELACVKVLERPSR